MAVKPIVNPNPPSMQQVDRSQQLSDKNNNVRGTGNSEQTVIPGNNYSDNYQVILKDVDTAVISHIKNVLRLKVRDNGEMVDVPVLYANQERWANIKTNGVMRDSKGSVILPVITLKRNALNFDERYPDWKHDVQGDKIQIVRGQMWSADNYYSNFTVQEGEKPVVENIMTTVPQYILTNYSFVVFTTYMEQMNSIVETFVQQSNTYWGDNTSYRFLCKVDGGISDATTMDVGSERLIRSEFTVNLNGYLIPETIANIVDNKKFNAKKVREGGKIVFSERIE
tara:strand:- start:790 stop:1635 length:846 start_codon:yes stop_codon:yes gene_type:complete